MATGSSSSQFKIQAEVLFGEVEFGFQFESRAVDFFYGNT